MIAVFAKSNNELRDLHMIPDDLFVKINSVDDIRGKRFTGVLAIYGWWEDKNLKEAYDVLEYYQPRLFQDETV